MYLNWVVRVCTAGPCRVGELLASRPASSAIRSARIACHGSVTRTAVCQPRSSNSVATARMLSSVSTPSGTASSASSSTPASARYSRPASASVNWSPAALPPTVTITGATPSSYRSSACSRRASKIDDGTPLYCADPSTTRASEGGWSPPRAGHQMASAVDATSNNVAVTAAISTRTTSRPVHAPTRHGYHAPMTAVEPLGTAWRQPPAVVPQTFVPPSGTTVSSVVVLVPPSSQRTWTWRTGESSTRSPRDPVTTGVPGCRYSPASWSGVIRARSSSQIKP